MTAIVFGAFLRGPDIILVHIARLAVLARRECLRNCQCCRATTAWPRAARAAADPVTKVRRPMTCFNRRFGAELRDDYSGITAGRGRTADHRPPASPPT